MRFIYTSKGMSKSLGCALSIEKYGTYLLHGAESFFRS